MYCGRDDIKLTTIGGMRKHVDPATNEACYGEGVNPLSAQNVRGEILRLKRYIARGFVFSPSQVARYGYNPSERAQESLAYLESTHEALLNP